MKTILPFCGRTHKEKCRKWHILAKYGVKSVVKLHFFIAIFVKERYTRLNGGVLCIELQWKNSMNGRMTGIANL